MRHLSLFLLYFQCFSMTSNYPGKYQHMFGNQSLWDISPCFKILPMFSFVIKLFWLESDDTFLRFCWASRIRQVCPYPWHLLMEVTDWRIGVSLITLVAIMTQIVTINSLDVHTVVMDWKVGVSLITLGASKTQAVAINTLISDTYTPITWL